MMTIAGKTAGMQQLVRMFARSEEHAVMLTRAVRRGCEILAYEKET